MLCRHPAKADAPCVAALKELGAVLLGKGAMVEFGIFSHGHNPHFGAMLNPHHPSRTAGGSSSGAAAAVATGICPIAIGTDGGGSIRVPASYCGVVGMKPTAGRLADDHCEYPARWHKLSVYRPPGGRWGPMACIGISRSRAVWYGGVCTRRALHNPVAVRVGVNTGVLQLAFVRACRRCTVCRSSWCLHCSPMLFNTGRRRRSMC